MLNILESIFLGLAFMVTFTGFLINNFENYVPDFIIKGYKYGSFAYKGDNAKFLHIIEMPKAYYRHFYVVSSLISTLTLFYMFRVYFLGSSVNYYIPLILRVFLEQDQPAIPGLSALVAMFLLTLQCWRRLYETYLLQVFAPSSRMNLAHYLAGHLHYIGCVIAIVGQAPLFCGGATARGIMLWSDVVTSARCLVCAVLFLCACGEQYRSHAALAALRRGRHGRSEARGVPRGRLFALVSSPHRACELLMYTALLALVPTRTFLCIYLWVLGNQIQTAIQAHEWYKKTFQTYPKDRFAIFPKIL